MHGKTEEEREEMTAIAAPEGDSVPHFHPTLDSCYFDLARKLVSLFEAEQGRRDYWEPAYAAASIVMACAAMEAHANYLLDRSARPEKAYDEYPNRLGLSVKAAEALCSTLTAEAKWLVVSLALAGKQVLDPGRAPLQGFCRAISVRNQYIVHAKLQPRLITGEADDIDLAFLPELRALTIAEAKAAITAAVGTLEVVYREIGKQLPKWAVGCLSGA